jgi:UDP:flavonoid glycosyltransferase YjiC (YdhE family)
MAAGTRQTNTMSEQLRKLLGSFADLKLSDDADFDYINKLETAVIAKLREPIDRAAQAGLTAVPPGISQGGMPPEMGGMPPEMAMMAGGAPMGPPPAAPMMGQGGITPSVNAAPAADELRRMLMSRGQ